MGNLLQSFFSQHGTPVPVMNSSPLQAEETGAVWMVTSGRVEIFGVVPHGGAAGPREHLLSVEKGGIFFPLSGSGAGVEVIGTGVFGTAVLKVSEEDLWKFGRSGPDAAAALAEALDAWIQLVSAMLADTAGNPQLHVLLQPGVETPAGKGLRAGAGTGTVVWVRGNWLSAQYLSRESLDAGSLVPLAHGCWISVFAQLGEGRDQPLPLSATTTAQSLSDPALRAGLARLHGWIASIKLQDLAFETAEQFQENLARQSERDTARLEAAQLLVSVMQGPGAEHFGTAADRTDDILVKACEALASRAGIRIRRHPDMGPAHDVWTNLNLLGKTSRFRTRRVLLEGKWWEEDCGLLLAFRKDGMTPVALLPERDGGYKLYDPRSGSTEKVSVDTARTLAPFACGLYRSLPDGEIRAMDFVKFAASGLKREFRIISLMSLFAGLLGMVTPWLTSKIFDSVIPASDGPMLRHYIAALVSSAIAVTAFNLVRSMAVLRVEGAMDYSGQSSIWSRMLDLPATFFRKYAAGDLADRAYAVDHIRSIVSQVGVTAVLGCTMAVFQGISMATIDMKLTAIGLGLIAGMVLVVTAANWLQLRLQRSEYSIRGKIASLALQLMTGVSKIRVAGAEEHALRVWATQFAQQKRVGFRIGGIQNFVELFKAVFPILCSMTLFAFFAKSQAESEGKSISTGDFIAFNTAFSSVLTALLGLAMGSLQLLEVIPIFERVRPIITEAAEVTDDRKHPGELKGNIEFYHISFRYTPDGPQILKNVDLKIRKGEFVALVGGSGSGKSTMLRLLLGFENPESGYVYYDGQDLATLDLREVRRQIGTVLQTSRLMPTTMFQNIVGASTKLGEYEAWQAARMSGLDKDIENMPMGMHTVVSEGGGGFSGGQKQRLMIARALVNRPRIVLFDEATSALDNRTQQIVTRSLRELDATRITIAHRLSTVVDADRIIVMHMGEVAETGTYAELMEKRGLFYELAARQQAEEEQLKAS